MLDTSNIIAIPSVLRFAGQALEQPPPMTTEQMKQYFEERKDVVYVPEIFPDQGTQHERGGAELDWQYPFKRQDLVEANLLPPAPPGVKQKRIELPPGVSVFEAIQAGILR